MRLKDFQKITDTLVAKAASVLEKAPEPARKAAMRVKPKTKAPENLRVIIWALLASGMIPSSLEPIIGAIAENPDTLANVAQLVVLGLNSLWWLWDRAIKGRE